MDLGKYVKDYEAAAQQKKDEAQRALERERDARLLNAEVVAKFLSEVVAPVLERAREQLVQAGCKAEVVWESKADADYRHGTPKTFALRIDLGTRRPDNTTAMPGVLVSHLYYSGGFRDRKINHATTIEWDGRIPTTHESLDMDALTPEKIEQHVESFVSTVFSSKGIK